MLQPKMLKSLGTERKKYKGLTTLEVKERLGVYGFNSRPRIKKKSSWSRLKHIVTEPMMMLILATAVLYYFIGELAESLIFLAAIVPIGVMEYLQQKRTDDTVAALDKMMVDKVKVYRNERLMDVEVEQLVPGDLVYLTAGDKVPADGYLLVSPGLSVDESMLTGESNPVAKAEVDGLTKIEENNLLRKGTLIIQGEGDFLVEATGLRTEYGRLGSLLAKITREKTPLQKKIYSLVRLIAVVALFTAVFVALFLSFTLGWREGVLGGLAMAMSLIPEEFPVVFSVFLIMGVWQMAKKNALVRQMAMVETLGSATVICTDKTGTLTEGRMSLEKIYYKNKLSEVKGHDLKKAELLEFLKISLLSFERNAVDPMEIETQEFARKSGVKVEEFFDDYEILKDSPFDVESKMVHHIWRKKDSSECGQYSVGAPESIMKICKMSDTDKTKAEEAYSELAANGYRVVGLARKNCECDGEVMLKGMEFVGLVVMSDPPREGVKEAIKVTQEAGIRVIMITGDNKMVANNIAERVGLKHASKGIIDGEELEKLSDAALKKAVLEHDIFTRVKPDHKFLIVSALQENGEIVAMTGDGVNDAPALKKADIGVAMGEKGTEVAREAAGIILLDDKFPTIAEAVKEGRRIYDNMRQAFVFLISFHIPIVGLAVLPLFFHQNLVFLPIHIIFLELICDPASVLGFQREKAARGIMKSPPRPKTEPIINGILLKRAIIQGLGIFLVSFGFYYYFGLYLGDLSLGRTMAFSSLVFSQIMLIFLTREWGQIKSNRVLILISLGTFLFLSLALFNGPLKKLFHFTSISLAHYFTFIIVSFLVMSLTGLLVVKRKDYV